MKKRIMTVAKVVNIIVLVLYSLAFSAFGFYFWYLGDSESAFLLALMAAGTALISLRYYGNFKIKGKKLS